MRLQVPDDMNVRDSLRAVGSRLVPTGVFKFNLLFKSFLFIELNKYCFRPEYAARSAAKGSAKKRVENNTDVTRLNFLY